MNDVREEESEPIGRWPSRFAPSVDRVNESSPIWANWLPANNPAGHNSAEAFLESNALAPRCSIRLATMILRTNLQETDPAVLWKRYIQLTEAEWAFRITKDELEIRPIWHQKTDRVLAHIPVCFLAYVLWKTLGLWMQRSGLGDAPRTLLEELSKLKSGDVVLPTRTKDGLYNGTVRLRCVTEPDEAQKGLLRRLGILLPRRLRRIDEFAQM